MGGTSERNVDKADRLTAPPADNERISGKTNGLLLTVHCPLRKPIPPEESGVWKPPCMRRFNDKTAGKTA
jgi:hypothetical protein